MVDDGCWAAWKSWSREESLSSGSCGVVAPHGLAFSFYSSSSAHGRLTLDGGSGRLAGWPYRAEVCRVSRCGTGAVAGGVSKEAWGTPGLCDISILADAGLRQWHGRDEDLVPSGRRDRGGGVGQKVEKGQWPKRGPHRRICAPGPNKSEQQRGLGSLVQQSMSWDVKGLGRRVRESFLDASVG